MTKEALFNLFKNKRIPQGSGKDMDYTLCLEQIHRQGQLTVDSVREMAGWAREYVGVTND